MASQKHDKFYLQKAKLSGFKSIKNTEAEFNSGLNIIIGKNAVGKTNFLKFLDSVLKESYGKLIDFSSSITFKGKKTIEILASRKISEKKANLDELLKKTNVIEKFKVNDIEVDYRDASFEILNSFIKHGIYKDVYIFEKPFRFSVLYDLSEEQNMKFDDDFYHIISNENTLTSLKMILIFLSINIFNIFQYAQNNKKEDFMEFLNNKLLGSKIKKYLEKYSPIKRIRFSNNVNLTQDKSNGKIEYSNIFLEYYVNNEWYTFNDLSDGTKRLLYIITEISYPKSIEVKEEPINFYRFYLQDKINQIILLEEPELGIHPHQLMQLMNFIKEVSKNKQIIITTHSPLVLDVLSKDELESINIAYIDNAKEGTKIRKLNVQEIKKAQLYMEDAYLSDYWKYSDLES